MRLRVLHAGDDARILVIDQAGPQVNVGADEDLVRQAARLPGVLGVLRFATSVDLDAGGELPPV